MRRVVVVLVFVLAAGIWPSGQGVAAVQATPAPGLQADFNNDGASGVVRLGADWLGRTSAESSSSAKAWPHGVRASP